VPRAELRGRQVRGQEVRPNLVDRSARWSRNAPLVLPTKFGEHVGHALRRGVGPLLRRLQQRQTTAIGAGPIARDLRSSAVTARQNSERSAERIAAAELKRYMKKKKSNASRDSTRSPPATPLQNHHIECDIATKKCQPCSKHV